jgi:hypothetical protein
MNARHEILNVFYDQFMPTKYDVLPYSKKKQLNMMPSHLRGPPCQFSLKMSHKILVTPLEKDMFLFLVRTA